MLFKRNQEKKEKPERPKETLPESIAGIASVLVVGLFILTFIVQHFEIPSRSMEMTLLVGDHVFVDRLTPLSKGKLGWLLPYRGIHRGDTAVFLTPNPSRTGNVPGQTHHWGAGRPDKAAQRRGLPEWS